MLIELALFCIKNGFGLVIGVSFNIFLESLLRMVVQTVVFGFTGLVLFVGTLVFMRIFSREEGDVELYVAPALVTFIAAVAYGLMTLSSAGYLSDGIVLHARYVDWVLTTSLIVFTLATVAGASDTVKYKAIGANVVTIVLGYVASVTGGAVKWGAFVVAAASFAVLIYYLVTALTESAKQRPPAVESMFLGLRNLTVFLWIAYPALWLLTDGLGVMAPADQDFLIAFMDITSKLGFNLIIALRARAIRTSLGEQYLGGGEQSVTG